MSAFSEFRPHLHVTRHLAPDRGLRAKGGSAGTSAEGKGCTCLPKAVVSGKPGTPRPLGGRLAGLMVADGVAGHMAGQGKLGAAGGLRLHQIGLIASIADA